MKTMLHQGHSVHRANEYRHVDAAMIERRFVKERRRQKHRADPGHELNETLHPSTLARRKDQ